MQNRPWLQAILTALLAALAAGLGIRVVPPEQPPIVVPPAPPPIVVPPPPPPPPPTPPEPKPDTLNAIVRISSGNTGCSATIIGPRRHDGRYWVLTAAHCVSGTNQHWGMRFRDGRSMGAVVVNLNKTSDWAWMLTESNTETLPFAYLNESSPPPGTPIWHAGYGVDKPANREDGVVTDVPNSEGQIRMRLSVSSGDSGGGIAITSDGKIVSCVCCTSGRGQVADVWGASVESIRRGQVAVVDLDEWKPIEIPKRMDPKK